MLLEKVKNGLDLPKDASNREEVFQDIKDKTTAWVAKYRRGAAFQGRPSYRYGAVSCGQDALFTPSACVLRSDV